VCCLGPLLLLVLGVGCRSYTAGGKTVGVPPEKWLVDALRRGVE